MTLLSYRRAAVLLSCVLWSFGAGAQSPRLPDSGSGSDSGNSSTSVEVEKSVPEGVLGRGELDREPLSDPAESTADAGESMGAMLFRTLVVLAVVVFSIYLTLNFGLRRLMGLKGPVGSGGVVTVIERVALDQRRSLFVIKAAGEYLLVGGGEGALNLICKLSSEEVERLAKERPPSLVMSPFLQKLLNRRGPPSGS